MGKTDIGPPEQPGRRRGAWARGYELLAGLELAFALMVLLGVLVALRALVAQRDMGLRQANAFIRWATSLSPEDPSTLVWPTVAVLALFVVNLALSSVEMTRKALLKVRALTAPRPVARFPAVTVKEGLEGGEDAGDRVERFLRARGWRVRRQDAGGEVRISGTRRERGHWGTLLFHLSFFVILAGAAVSLLTSFTGYFELAPGESFVERSEAYLRRTDTPLLFPGDRGFRVELEKMDLTFWPEGGVRDRASWIRLHDAAGVLRARARLAVNSPVSFDGITLYQASKEGFIAGITVKDSAGTTSRGILHFPFPVHPGDPMQTTVQLPGTALVLAFELHTGLLARIANLTGERHEVSLMKVFEHRGPRSRPLGVVFGGGEVSFEGLTLSFDSLKPYMSFAVVQDHGVPVIFAALAFALAALLALYFWVPETMWAVAAPAAGGGVRVLVAGSTERYENAFEARFREMLSELRAELARR